MSSYGRRYPGSGSVRVVLSDNKKRKPKDKSKDESKAARKAERKRARRRQAEEEWAKWQERHHGKPPIRSSGAPSGKGE